MTAPVRADPARGTTACPCSPSRSRRSTRCWSRSARSRSAGTRWPTSPASCSAGAWCGGWSSGRAGSSRPRRSTILLFYVTLGIILGGRLGYVLFYQPGHYLDPSARHPGRLARRHVVPRRPDRRACRRPSVRPQPRARLFRGRPTRWPWRRRSACSSAGSPTSSTASCGAGSRTCPGPSSSRRPAGAAPPEPALRGRRSRASCCSPSCSGSPRRPLPPEARGRSAASS